MNQDLDLKDYRVPTFIPYEVEDDKKTKKITKRKRTTQPDSKPNKRKAKKAIAKDGPVDELNIPEEPKLPQENQIWIGATVEKDHGAFGVYFAEKDERNFCQVFTKKNELQDLDYAYVLGTLKAIESLKSIEEPLVVNTTCRDLPRAIAGRGKNFHYKDISDRIRDAIKETGKDVQVRYSSGRTSSVEHKIATVLAKDALEKHLKPKIVVEEKVQEEKIVDGNTFIEESTLKEDTPQVEKIILDGKSIKESEEKQIDNLVIAEVAAQKLDELTTSTITTTVTTEVTTEVEVTVTEKEQSNNGEDMELDQEEVKAKEEAAPSSWASVFGIRNLLDVLYAPFKTRKSS